MPPSQKPLRLIQGIDLRAFQSGLVLVYRLLLYEPIGSEDGFAITIRELSIVHYDQIIQRGMQILRDAIDYSVPLLKVLPEIRAAVPEMTIPVDSGFKRGADVLKALALGADGGVL